MLAAQDFERAGVLERGDRAADDVINEMFESSGQLKSEYKNDPRLRAWFEATGQTDDP